MHTPQTNAQFPKGTRYKSWYLLVRSIFSPSKWGFFSVTQQILDDPATHTDAEIQSAFDIDHRVNKAELVFVGIVLCALPLIFAYLPITTFYKLEAENMMAFGWAAIPLLPLLVYLWFALKSLSNLRTHWHSLNRLQTRNHIDDIIDVLMTITQHNVHLISPQKMIPIYLSWVLFFVVLIAGQPTVFLTKYVIGIGSISLLILVAASTAVHRITLHFFGKGIENDRKTSGRLCQRLNPQQSSL